MNLLRCFICDKVSRTLKELVSSKDHFINLHKDKGKYQYFAFSVVVFKRKKVVAVSFQRMIPKIEKFTQKKLFKIPQNYIVSFFNFYVNRKIF